MIQRAFLLSFSIFTSLFIYCSIIIMVVIFIQVMCPLDGTWNQKLLPRDE